MMERNEVGASSGKKFEAAFAPEWLKNSVAISGVLSQTLDDHGAAPTPRNKALGSVLDHENTRYSQFIDRSSISNRRSFNDKEVLSQHRSSSSFKRDREKITGFQEFSNLESSVNGEKELLRRSQSMITSRISSAWNKKIGSDVFHGIPSGNSSGPMAKTTFEREFPHLGTEERQWPPDIVRVSSPGVSNVARSAVFYSSVAVGGDGWTSALAEMPVTTPSTGSGLNMAEALVQVPVRALASPKKVDDNIRLEELAIKMSRRLIPVTPASPKILGVPSSQVNFAYKVKSNGSRTADQSGKVGQKTLSDTGALSYRGPNKPDSPKTPQIGNFQVLSRERNTVSPPNARNDPSLTCMIRPLTSTPVAASVNSSLKSPQPTQPNGKPVAQQNRNDFFNSLRKKTSEGSTASSSDKSKNALTTLGKGEEPIINSGCSPTQENKSMVFDPAAEERLLHLLGWKEDAGDEEECLTAAEIDAFISEYEKRRPSSESCHRSFLLAKAMLTEMGGGAC
ncbi:uncharacterized protein LOC144704488 isoform X2 [Wolffia australiana]